MTYSQHFSIKETPQSEPIPGKAMMENNAGGFVFAVTPWSQLERFLFLGAEGGTYYVGERKLTVENAKNVIQCIKENGEKVVRTIVEISDSGRAPKNDPAIFALALACAFGDAKTKAQAYAAIPHVCRIGTHLFQFCQDIQNLRGWSRGLRKGVSSFYAHREAQSVAYQLIKYQQRDGWTHKDVLRLAHPSTPDPLKNSLFRYAVGKTEASQVQMPVIRAADEIKRLTTSKTDIKQAIELITEHDLPREAIPTEMLNNVEIWNALLQRMPMTALIRNLGKMTAVCLLKSNFDDASKFIVGLLGNQEVLKKSRIHPISILLALKTYQQGRGMKGSLSWNPVSSVVEALNEAFYLAFANVEPTGKNYLLGLDVSGSMGSTISGMPISAREVVAALATVTVRTEPSTEAIAFSNEAVRFPLYKTEKLDAMMTRMAQLPFSSTDCSLPMLYALKHRLPVDIFVVYTDNETWAGKVHPKQALDSYRQKMGRPSKLIVLATSATGFSIADPSDSGMLDISGMDSSVPEVMSAFVRE